MQIRGKLIGTLCGHTENSPYLVNRKLEIYESERRIKLYLFNSSYPNWHTSNNLIKTLPIVKKGEIIENIYYHIRRIIETNQISFNGEFSFNNHTFVYNNGCEIHNKNCGYYSIDMNNCIHYYGGLCAEGKCYKDYDAWKNGNGVIYIGEYQLVDFENGNVDKSELWTKKSWCDWVRMTITNNYKDLDCYTNMLSNIEFIESIAYRCLAISKWGDLSTSLDAMELTDGLTIYDMWLEFNEK